MNNFPCPRCGNKITSPIDDPRLILGKPIDSKFRLFFTVTCKCGKDFNFNYSGQIAQGQILIDK